MKKHLLLIAFLSITQFQINAQGAWQAISNAPVASRHDDLMFINDSVGYTGGGDGILYKTSDRGTTWDSLSTFVYYIRSIEFINDTLGYVGLLTLSMPDGLYRTTDGGVTFNSLNALVPGGFGAICGLDHKGDTLIAVGSFDEPAFFYKTSDNGQSFIKVDMSPYASALVECFMMDAYTYFLGGVSDSASGYKAIILKTTDGGVTWSQVAIAASPALSYCWKLFFRPGGLGFGSIENGNYTVFRTTDYGNTWQEIYTDSALGGNAVVLGGIAFINDTLGWVGLQHAQGYCQSTDGGLTWTSDTATSSINRIVVLDSVTALAAGYTIYRYNFNITSAEEHFVDYVPLHSLHIYPNPVVSNAVVKLNLGSNTSVLLDILDSKNAYVKRIIRIAKNKGTHEIPFSTTGLKAGIYNIVLRTNEIFLSEKFEIVK